MRIAMDTREANSDHPTGKGLFARNVLLELKKRGIAIDEYDSGRGFGFHLKTARTVKQSGCDIYLSLTSFVVPWLLGTRVPVAIVLHDLIAFDSSPHNRKAMLIERLLLPRVLKTATIIFCVSEATKQDLIARFPEVDDAKIATIYEGPTMTKPTNLQTYKPYILSIGTLSPRKNQLRLIEAFKKLPDSLRSKTSLILAGSRGWDDAEIVSLAEQTPNVEWRGYVQGEALTELMANALLLAYPSLTEGFGLPVLDAMALGIPVLTSNRSSMKEVAGDAALLVDPLSVDAMSAGLNTLLTDENLRSTLRAKGIERSAQFSWERTVDLMLQELKKLIPNCDQNVRNIGEA